MMNLRQQPAHKPCRAVWHNVLGDGSSPLGTATCFLSGTHHLSFRADSLTSWLGEGIECSLGVPLAILDIAPLARRTRSAARVYKLAIPPPCHPKIASSSATVAPFSAARV